jgi:hypothetical protein
MVDRLARACRKHLHLIAEFGPPLRDARRDHDC